jgi:hypothetical protein
MRDENDVLEVRRLDVLDEGGGAVGEGDRPRVDRAAFTPSREIDCESVTFEQREERLPAGGAHSCAMDENERHDAPH